MPEFVGIDPGRWGGVARILATLEHDEDLRVLEVALAPLPVVERDGGGHEVDALALRDLLAGREFARGVIERPALGGQLQRGALSVIAQGATFGEALAVLKLTGCPIDQQPSSASTRRELGLPTVPRGGDRKQANVDDAEILLRRWACPVLGPPPARGYHGQIGGCRDSRSGMGDALLLAWLGVRRWAGVDARKPRRRVR